MGEWTKEPWTARGGEILDAGGYAFLEGAGTYAINRQWLEENDGHWALHDESHRSMGDGESEAACARAAACVNALAGIPDPAATMKEVVEVLEAVLPVLPIGFASTSRPGAADDRNEELNTVRERVTALLSKLSVGG